MESKKIYQTLEDRENPDQIEQEGPFPCSWNNSWLGTGHYFWDTFIENAHWWGKTRLDNKYVICEAHFNFCTTTCFDLVGKTEHMLDFERSIGLMKTKKLLNNKTTVARVLSYMQNTLKIFDYKAIRVYGVHSKSKDLQPNYQMKFELGKPQYLDYKPAIQICIYNFSGLSFKDFTIVYPYDYVSGYVV
ncbi:hypothetical protein [Bizionia sp.]|uniref:hypothetical protein n=1 Tax=Bizionia sp. TaxID=1954480 RepID=UPI003A8D48EB